MPDVGQRILDLATRIAALGPRLPGTPAETRCHRLACELLEEATGTSPMSEEFPFLDWIPTTQTLAPVGSGRMIPCRQLGYSGIGEVVGESYHCGDGSKEDCAAVDGKIAVCSQGIESSLRHLHRIQKYRNVVEAGALSFILVGEPGYSVPLGMIRKRSRGNIPALAVAYRDAVGELTTRNRSQGFRASADNVTTDSISSNTVLRLGGGGKGIVFCAHVDSWTRGAWDNASGVATLIELARWISEGNLEHSATVCLTGAEEYGLFGSIAFCERHASEFEFAINVDGVGLGGAELQARSSDRELAGIPPLRGVFSDLPLTAWGDHYSFHRAGVRTLLVTSGGTSPVQHTEEDGPERLNPEQLKTSLGLLERIATHLDSIF